MPLTVGHGWETERVADPVFFASAAEWRDWLEAHHESETECLVGFIKVTTGEANLTWSESVDQALCFGWIDGVRRGVDERSYSIRFTPRKPASNWSAINCAKVEALRAAGLMTPAGEAAFRGRTESKTAIYSYERGASELEPDQAEALRANERAWEFWAAQPPWYLRNATHWVVDAKRPETRDRRFAQLLADSAAGLRVRHLRGDRPQ
jgi:uncharacterized protein YdeI (YjbR/CyaY-like superfamily)